MEVVVVLCMLVITVCTTSHSSDYNAAPNNVPKFLTSRQQGETDPHWNKKNKLISKYSKGELDFVPITNVNPHGKIKKKLLGLGSLLGQLLTPVLSILSKGPKGEMTSDCGNTCLNEGSTTPSQNPCTTCGVDGADGSTGGDSLVDLDLDVLGGTGDGGVGSILGDTLDTVTSVLGTTGLLGEGMKTEHTNTADEENGCGTNPSCSDCSLNCKHRTSYEEPDDQQGSLLDVDLLKNGNIINHRIKRKTEVSNNFNKNKKTFLDLNSEQSVQIEDYASVVGDTDLKDEEMKTSISKTTDTMSDTTQDTHLLTDNTSTNPELKIKSVGNNLVNKMPLNAIISDGEQSFEDQRSSTDGASEVFKITEPKDYNGENVKNKQNLEHNSNYDTRLNPTVNENEQTKTSNVEDDGELVEHFLNKNKIAQESYISNKFQQRSTEYKNVELKESDSESDNMKTQHDYPKKENNILKSEELINKNENIRNLENYVDNTDLETKLEAMDKSTLNLEGKEVIPKYVFNEKEVADRVNNGNVNNEINQREESSVNKTPESQDTYDYKSNQDIITVERKTPENQISTITKEIDFEETVIKGNTVQTQDSMMRENTNNQESNNGNRENDGPKYMGNRSTDELQESSLENSKFEGVGIQEPNMQNENNKNTDRKNKEIINDFKDTYMNTLDSKGSITPEQSIRLKENYFDDSESGDLKSTENKIQDQMGHEELGSLVEGYSQYSERENISPTDNKGTEFSDTAIEESDVNSLSQNSLGKENMLNTLPNERRILPRVWYYINKYHSVPILYRRLIPELFYKNQVPFKTTRIRQFPSGEIINNFPQSVAGSDLYGSYAHAETIPHRGLSYTNPFQEVVG